MDLKSQTKYLIIGGSHAGLTALDEIRVYDSEGSITVVSKEYPPYSPTVLPYIISGKINEHSVFLRDDQYFSEKKVNLVKNRSVVEVNKKASEITLDDGQRIQYEKLLIASGAGPTLPSIPGLSPSSAFTLRTLADVQRILQEVSRIQSALVLGAGLIGMHIAECLAQKGMRVEVAEMLPQILPGYFDLECSELIRREFASHEINCYTNNSATRVETSNGKVVMNLQKGQRLEGGILIATTGVRACFDFLVNSEIRTDRGILVDDTMRTSVENVWAAGDVAQAKDFFSDKKVLSATLPDAVVQGKIAGQAMVGVKSISPYPGSIPMNTFNFFGNRALAIGFANPEEKEGYEIDTMYLPTAKIYQKMVFKNNCLVGGSAINSLLDSGILLNLIRRKVDMAAVKAEFVGNPVQMSRRLMWKTWRKEEQERRRDDTG
jgi:phenylglyoxylate dehydrogenase epsilon subunit